MQIVSIQSKPFQFIATFFGANLGATTVMNKPTACLFLDTRKAKKNGKFPLKLTIYNQSRKKRYTTGVDLTVVEWEKINGKRLKEPNLKEVKASLNKILEKSANILDNLMPFSFIAFEKKFFEHTHHNTIPTLDDMFRQYIESLESEGRERTRASYQTTINSINNFRNNLKLTDVTKEFLQDYESHMRREGKSPSTIGIYLRQLRCIINKGIATGIIPRDLYPFTGFDIPATRNIKKALSDEELQKLLSYQPELPHEKKSIAFWKFSYLCNGINFTDIAHLKKECINNGCLYFFRQKTLRTKKRDLRPIKVALHPQAKEIIQEWSSTAEGNTFLFPILEDGLSAKTIKNRVQAFIKKTNGDMDMIRKQLGISSKVGTYVARHSFSSRLMRKGVSTHFIKESLGHSSVSVTESYLADFPDLMHAEYSKLLTEFDTQP